MKDFICPYDGFKLRIYNNAEYVNFLLDNNDKFHFIERKFVGGDIIDYPKSGDFKGLSIKIHETNKGPAVTISGSFHKWFSEDGTNVQQFYWSDFVKVHDKIKEELQIPSEAVIINLEIGLNIEIPEHWGITASEILRSFYFIKTRSNRCVKSIKEYSGGGYSIHKNSEDYNYKIYDKGMQHAENRFLMRYEKKFIKSRPLSKLKIVQYSDLLNQEAFTNIKRNLLLSWEDFIIYDEIIDKSITLTQDDQSFLLKIKRRDYFENSLLQTQDFKSDKLRYLNLMEVHAKRNIHQLLSKIISRKLELDI